MGKLSVDEYMRIAQGVVIVKKGTKLLEEEQSGKFQAD